MKVTTAERNRMIDAHAARYNNGYLRIYSGTRPANANTALSGNTLLAELRWNATAFAAASAASATANAITQDSSADATGTASFVRNFESDGITVLSDMSLGTSGAEVTISTLSITSGGIVQASAATISMGTGS